MSKRVEPLAVTRRQAAKILNLTEARLSQLYKSGDGPPCRTLAGRFFYDKTALLAWRDRRDLDREAGAAKGALLVAARHLRKTAAELVERAEALEAEA